MLGIGGEGMAVGVLDVIEAALSKGPIEGIGRAKLGVGPKRKHVLYQQQAKEIPLDGVTHLVCNRKGIVEKARRLRGEAVGNVARLDPVLVLLGWSEQPQQIGFADHRGVVLDQRLAHDHRSLGQVPRAVQKLIWRPGVVVTSP
jgi:hypothetical protein